ncbi:hypothetical protein ACPPVU_05985 [Mucilaginibacter sp. McL0603]|uniref:hypothetical protein n=1 Tax=Mucilaginibacter sp. McL0603 TaxID=3415670 RepID=UPI003CF1BFA8
MAWLDKLNGNYSLETANSKNNIITLLNERIENAKKDSSWFTFKTINYEKFVLEGDLVTISRAPTMFTPYAGYGTISINFSTNKNTTVINAQVIPYGEMRAIVIGFVLFFLIMFSGFIWLTTYGSTRYSIIAIAWIVPYGFLFLGMLYYKHKLKTYLKKVLEDLNIEGNLSSTTH